MISGFEVIIYVIILVILIIWAIYIVLAYRRNFFPFGVYVPASPSNGTLLNESPTPFTADQISQRQQSAVNLCNYAANTQNYMSLYCGVQPFYGSIDCSALTND